MTTNVKELKFRPWSIFLVLLILVIFSGAAVMGSVLRDINGVNIEESITVDVAEGSGSSSVAQLLYDNGAIRYPSLFKIYSRLGGYDGEYKPGNITIKKGMSYNDILSSLVTSERDARKLVIPEGYSIKQIAQAVADGGFCTEEEFYNALDPSFYDYEFLKNLPDREQKLEGYLFPATYDIEKGTTPREIVDIMLSSFSDMIDKYKDRAKEVNMTIDETVIMASIIERETNADTERAKVAGVFYNRLNSDMKLESCATVQYILGENKPVLSVEDTRIESPYNTYINEGLPVGPICSPGEECIKAALYPEKTDAFYFMLGKNGEHIFSHTYEEHKKAMEENGL